MGSLSTKKGLFWEKILINIEFKGQKLTNSHKKKKKLYFGPKKQAGPELKKQKRTFWPKFGKKFENKVQKLQAGAELKNKKGLFWAKILIKIEFRGQKLTNSQKKKKNYISGQKKTSWG